MQCPPYQLRDKCSIYFFSQTFIYIVYVIGEAKALPTEMRCHQGLIQYNKQFCQITHSLTAKMPTNLDYFIRNHLVKQCTPRKRNMLVGSSVNWD